MPPMSKQSGGSMLAAPFSGIRGPNDNAIDPLGQIGAPIRPDPDPIAEALKSAGLPIVTEGQAEDWEEACADFAALVASLR